MSTSERYATTSINEDDDYDDDHDNDSIAAMFRGMGPVSAAAAVAVAEDAAEETGLALEHARVALDAAMRAESQAAKAAVDAEGKVTVALQAAAAGAPGLSGGSETLFYGGGRGGVDNPDSNGESAAFSGGGLQEAPVNSGEAGIGVAGLRSAVGRTTGEPLQISFLTPSYGTTTPGIAATSYGSGDSETLTAGEMETMMSRLSSRRHGHALDTPGPSIVIQHQPPLSWADESPRSRTERTTLQRERQGQAKPRLLPHHLAATPTGNRGGLGRGGWRGGDVPPTTAASTSLSAVEPAPFARTTGKVQPVPAISNRRLASTNRFGRGEGGTWGSSSGGESGSAVAAAAETGIRDEAEWVRSMLFSGPGTPGLVVDLWSPGAIFLRHVEVILQRKGSVSFSFSETNRFKPWTFWPMLHVVVLPGILFLSCPFRLWWYVYTSYGPKAYNSSHISKVNCSQT